MVSDKYYIKTEQHIRRELRDTYNFLSKIEPKNHVIKFYDTNVSNEIKNGRFPIGSTLEGYCILLAKEIVRVKGWNYKIPYNSGFEKEVVLHLEGKLQGFLKNLE